MKVIGYGEDALTYWALTKNLSETLKQLGENSSNISDCLVIYRPSFGRRGGKNSAQFGEFDSILATPKSIYLIESKHYDNADVNKGLLRVQTLRHEIFKWYCEKWKNNNYRDWSEFVKDNEKGFDDAFGKEKIIVKKGKLADNLYYILELLKKHCIKYGCSKIQNILFVFKPRLIEITEKESMKLAAEFRRINIKYNPIKNSNYLEID